MEGGRGVIKVDQHTIKGELMAACYSPVLVEEFIPGIDVGISVYCEVGEIKACICHTLEKGVYKVIENSTFRESVDRILINQKCSGIYNFDARIAPDGALYMLECNPRFYYKMCLSLLAGLNLPALGVFPSGTLANAPGRPFAHTPGGILRKVMAGSRISSELARDARFWMSDPVLLLYEMLRIPRDLRSDTSGYLDFLAKRLASVFQGVKAESTSIQAGW
jgi:hypothetical protein